MKLNIFKKGIVKDTAIYTVTDAIGKAVVFLLLPFVSKYIAPDELGMATNFTVFANIITLLAGIAIINSIPYFYYEQSAEDNAKLVSHLLLYALSVCVILFVFIMLLSGFIEKKLAINFYIQLLCIPYVFLDLTCNISFILLRLEDKAYSFAGFQLLRIFLNTLFVVLLVIVAKMGGLGKIFSDILVVSCVSVLHIIRLIKNKYILLRFDPLYMKKILKFGIPLLPHSLSSWLKDGLDKVFITSFCGLYQNGLFSMAISISSIYKMVNNAFFNAYTPYLQKTLASITPENENVIKKRIVKLTYVLWLCFMIVSIVSIGAAWLIINYMIDSKYLPSFRFIPGLILSYYIYAVYSFTIQFIYKQKKTLGLGIITFFGSIIQMIIGYILIRNYGVMGSVYSSIIGALLISIAIFWYSNKVYKMPWLTILNK